MIGNGEPLQLFDDRAPGIRAVFAEHPGTDLRPQHVHGNILYDQHRQNDRVDHDASDRIRKLHAPFQIERERVDDVGGHDGRCPDGRRLDDINDGAPEKGPEIFAQNPAQKAALFLSPDFFFLKKILVLGYVVLETTFFLFHNPSRHDVPAP